MCNPQCNFCPCSCIRRFGRIRPGSHRHRSHRMRSLSKLPNSDCLYTCTPARPRTKLCSRCPCSCNFGFFGRRSDILPVRNCNRGRCIVESLLGPQIADQVSNRALDRREHLWLQKEEEGLLQRIISREPRVGNLCR